MGIRFPVGPVATQVGPRLIERTSKAISWPANTDQAVELASLRTAVAAGNTIFANDINRIATLINNMNGHVHTYDDAFQLATFGNTGDRNNYLEDKNTNNIDAVTNAPTNTASDTTITASRHNELRDALNQLRVHFHGIDDRTA
jgi:glutamine synthetase type III